MKLIKGNLYSDCPQDSRNTLKTVLKYCGTIDGVHVFKHHSGFRCYVESYDGYIRGIGMHMIHPVAAAPESKPMKLSTFTTICIALLVIVGTVSVCVDSEYIYRSPILIVTAVIIAIIGYGRDE